MTQLAWDAKRLGPRGHKTPRRVCLIFPGDFLLSAQLPAHYPWLPYSVTSVARFTGFVSY
jgi:hypothetical protein